MTNNDRHQSAREFYEERAGVLEHDANLSRADAERRAKIETAEWIKAHRPDDEVQK